MANTNAPSGGKPINTLVASDFTSKTNVYSSNATDAQIIYANDFVKLSGGANNRGLLYVAQATASDRLVGAALSIKNFYDNETPIYRAANTELDIFVLDDPFSEFEIQANGSITAADIGKYADLVFNAGSTITGLSGIEVDVSTLSDDTGQIRILGLIERDDNTFGNYAKLRCIIHFHALNDTEEDLFRKNYTTDTITPRTVTDKFELHNDLKVNADAHITGKLTVDGLIDPTGMVLTPQASPPITDDGSFYYDSVGKTFKFRSDGIWVDIPDAVHIVNVAADFPTLSQVYPGYKITAGSNVTDNDPTKTNTGQSFLAGQEGFWNNVNWSLYGSDALWLDNLTDLYAVHASRNIDVQDGALKDNFLPGGVRVNKLVDKDSIQEITANKTFSGDTSFTAIPKTSTDAKTANPEYEFEETGSGTRLRAGYSNAGFTIRQWSGAVFMEMFNVKKPTNTNGGLILNTSGLTNSRVWLTPDTSGTMPLLETANTWTALNSFDIPVKYSSDMTVVAYAGGGQALATPLTKELNHVITCATDYDSVLLPAAPSVGQIVRVDNAGANILSVYPAASGIINSQVAATAYDISNTGAVSFQCTINTPGVCRWYTVTVIHSTTSEDLWDRVGIGGGLFKILPHISGANGDKVEIKANDPTTWLDQQLDIKGSATTGLASTGAGIAFWGHNGSVEKPWGNLSFIKANSTPGDNLSRAVVDVSNAGGTQTPSTQFDTTGCRVVVAGGAFWGPYLKLESGIYTNTLSTAALSADISTQFPATSGTVALLSVANVFTPKQSYSVHPTFSADTEIVDKKFVEDHVNSALNGFINPVIDAYTPTLSQTVFTLSQTRSAEFLFLLTLNGIIKEEGVDFTVSGTILTWLDPAGLTLKTTDRLIARYYY